jgi:hypothetical protein
MRCVEYKIMFPFEANTYNADSANVLRAIGNVHYTSQDWVLAKEFYTFAMDAVIFATTAAIGVVGADPSYRDYHDPDGQRDAAATAQYDGNTKLMALHGCVYDGGVLGRRRGRLYASNRV